MRGDRVRITARTYDQDGKRVGRAARGTLPALVVPQAVAQGGPQVVLSTRAAARLGLPTGVVGLAVSGTDITGQQEQDVVEALAAASDNASFYVERGYQPDDATRILQWVLFGLGALLMLGGTLTATFLALSDARPDGPTELGQVGARVRRGRGRSR